MCHSTIHTEMNELSEIVKNSYVPEGVVAAPPPSYVARISTNTVLRV